MSTHLASIKLAAGTSKGDVHFIAQALGGTVRTYEVSAATGLQTLHISHRKANSDGIHDILRALPSVLAYFTDVF